MDFFKKYTSNTLASTGNHYVFTTENENRIIKSRTFYKVFHGGEYNYSFLFSNIIDSTYADGSVSHKNMITGSYKIHEMNVGVTDYCDYNYGKEPKEWLKVTFNSKREKTANPGEFFCTDEVKISAQKNEYICVELLFSGKTIPKNEQSPIPSFVLKNGVWEISTDHPAVAMVGCDRKVKGRIAFLGDSITQGSGAPFNSYLGFAAVASENTSDDYAFWNIGLGFARADDAASDGAWLYKAKQNDIVVMCFGVNDILHGGFNAEDIKARINIIIDKLNENGTKVILQTTPPFDYQGEQIEVWNNVNNCIKAELSKKVLAVFDCVPFLSKSESEPQIAKYGGHPNGVGGKIWGEALAKKLKEVIL